MRPLMLPLMKHLIILADGIFLNAANAKLGILNRNK